MSQKNKNNIERRGRKRHLPCKILYCVSINCAMKHDHVAVYCQRPGSCWVFSNPTNNFLIPLLLIAGELVVMALSSFLFQFSLFQFYFFNSPQFDELLLLFQLFPISPMTEINLIIATHMLTRTDRATLTQFEPQQNAPTLRIALRRIKLERYGRNLSEFLRV